MSPLICEGCARQTPARGYTNIAALRKRGLVQERRLRLTVVFLMQFSWSRMQDDMFVSQLQWETGAEPCLYKVPMTTLCLRLQHNSICLDMYFSAVCCDRA